MQSAMNRIEQLIAAFDQVTEFPIEISEVRDYFLTHFVQDEIVFRPDEKMDKAVLRGLYYQFSYRKEMYGDRILCSLIIYSSQISREWQRVICCKELIHILDAKSEQTKSIEELDGLMRRILGPLSTEDFDVFDIMAAKDRLALYQAIPVLFPMSARERALSLMANGTKLEEIATQVSLPTNIVAVAMTEEWPDLIHNLCC